MTISRQRGRSSGAIGIDRFGNPVQGRTQAPTPVERRYTLQRDGDRPVQFDGEELVSVESRGSPITHRAAVYRTRGGKFISEFSSRPVAARSHDEPQRQPSRDELCEYRNLFIEKVIHTAEWREGKAVQFPNDTRNSRSAEALRGLATELDRVHHTNSRWLCLWLAENDLPVDDDELLKTRTAQEEGLSELMRQYGFYGTPDVRGASLDALAFLDAAIGVLEVDDDQVQAAGKAAVFDSLDEALKWFRRGPLTTELLKKLGKLEPEFIE